MRIINLNPNLNVDELDDKPCALCGKIPPIKRIRKAKKTFIDRSSRIDCDASRGEKESRLVTYHVACWKKLVLKKK